MKKEPKKVFILKNNTYVELSHKEFCELKESDFEYQDKKFIMLHQMLLEVSESDRKNFYRNKRRQKYLRERAKKGRDVSADQPIKDKADFEYKLEDIVEDVNQDLAGQAERNIMVDKLIDCLDHLSAEEIYVLYLRFDEELTEKKIGQIFNISQQAVSKRMGNMRTLAFQVPEELFQKIKDYLQRNNMTQKEFVIGLIENEIERDLSQRADLSEATTDAEEVAEEHTEQQEEAAVSDSESISEEVGAEPEERESADFSDDFDGENEDEDLGEEQDETEDVGMTMGM